MLYACPITHCVYSYRAVFLKMVSAETQGSAKGCQGFRQTKMRNGGRVLLAVPLRPEQAHGDPVG